MFGNAIRPETFVAFDEEIIKFSFPAGTADSAHGIGDDASGFDESSFEQGQGGEQDAGRVTTGRGDERSLFNFGPMNFRQSVNGFF